MEVISGQFDLPERNLQFDLSCRLDLKSEDNCYFLRGENGVGKTSFLEKVIIPALDRQQIGYMYIGQDIRIQLYTLRAMLATLGHRVKGIDELEIFKIWIQHSSSARFFILDEFDKYFSQYDFIFEWSHMFIRNYIFVTHSDHICKPMNITPRYRTHNLRFEPLPNAGALQKVRVNEDPAWQ